MATINILRILPFALLLTACLGDPQTIVEVEVLDRETREILDSAEVVLYQALVGGEPTPMATKWSANQQKTVFVFQALEGYSYSVATSRRYFEAGVREDGGSYANEAVIQLHDTNRIELQLDAILPPDPDRYTKMHAQVPVNQVVAAITTDEWAWTFLPRMFWEDVPALLQISGDTSYVHAYPRHPLSTYRPDSVRAGLVALWLVEAIRKQESKGDTIPGNLMPPSRAPVLGTKYGNPKGYNSPEQIQTAVEAYQEWWNNGQLPEADKLENARKNPLVGKGLSWM